MNRMFRGLPAGEVASPMRRWTRQTMVRRNSERDPDPVVDGPHQVRIQGSLVSKGGVVIDSRDYAASRHLVAGCSDSSSLTVRSGCRASSRTVAQPILRR